MSTEQPRDAAQAPSPQGTNGTLLELHGISKRFGPVRALTRST